MDLKLSDEQLRAIVADALFNQIDQTQIQKMVTGALVALMQPQKNDYGREVSPGRLQSAVEEALLKVAREVVGQEMAKGEVQAQISSLVTEAIERVMVKERERTVEHMASSFRSALWSLRKD
jgi:hypothetical protein